MDLNLAGNGYALWFLPEEQAYSRLASQILALSREYSTPAFEPHVTLLSSIRGPEDEVLLKSSRLAPLIQPFEVRLTSFGFFDDYFRSLFVRVAPTDPIMKASQTAREIFSLHHRPPYMPHLSVMYSSFPEEAKKEIAADLGASFDLSFHISNVHLYSVENSPEEWRRVETFSLG